MFYGGITKNTTSLPETHNTVAQTAPLRDTTGVQPADCTLVTSQEVLQSASVFTQHRRVAALS